MLLSNMEPTRKAKQSGQQNMFLADEQQEKHV